MRRDEEENILFPYKSEVSSRGCEENKLYLHLTVTLINLGNYQTDSSVLICKCAMEPTT